jgi:hypothetical protein
MMRGSPALQEVGGSLCRSLSSFTILLSAMSRPLLLRLASLSTCSSVELDGWNLYPDLKVNETVAKSEGEAAEWNLPVSMARVPMMAGDIYREIQPHNRQEAKGIGFLDDTEKENVA